MRTAALVLMLLSLTLTTTIVPAAGNEYRLQDGSRVTVDPNTRRATVTRQGVSTQLWDGAHRMEDGSLMIINRGVSVIPREPAIGERPPEEEAADWIGTPIAGYSPCERLARTACGKEDQCAEADGCSLARQLLAMEQEERKSAENPNRMTYTSGQCQAVAGDTTLFPACSR